MYEEVAQMLESLPKQYTAIEEVKIKVNKGGLFIEVYLKGGKKPDMWGNYIFRNI